MNVRCLFSSPTGDIPVDEALLSRRFLVNPMEEHPHLQLGDYFRAIERFALGEEGEVLRGLLERVLQRPIRPSDVGEVAIRSEKHGGLYHLASVEALGPGLSRKFVVSAAVTERSAEWLRREFETLNLLNGSFRLPYLPEVYLLEEVGGFVLMLGQWFEDFHEWHLHREEGGEPQPVIWDFRKGYRRAEEKEAAEIYRQASRILTLYYDVKSTHQITPWLHAAGDFIVRSDQGAVEVRLTTARGYEPLVIFLEQAELNHVMAMVSFFLNLTIRMRLDRWEGVGEIAWARDSCVGPTVAGFFDGLRAIEAGGRVDLGRAADFLSLLRTFRADELRRLALPLLELYGREDREALAAVEKGLDDHCMALFSAIRDLPEG